ncbi:Tn3 family transposase [Nonomuraea dietziae]|uniref:Tn3 family transposase n=1 Tax=Nonomuraea dietziae TaxID=65515 RepID=UPI0016148F60
MVERKPLTWSCGDLVKRWGHPPALDRRTRALDAIRLGQGAPSALDVIFSSGEGRRADVIVTDTGSYSDLVFGLAHLLDREYRPAAEAVTPRSSPIGCGASGRSGQRAEPAPRRRRGGA